MADPYAAFSTPANADPYAAISRPVTGPAASADVMGGGVQDFEPITTRHMGTVELPNDRAGGWFTTRIRNAATNVAGIPRGIADTNKAVVNALGLPPQVATAANWLNPITAGGQFMPSSHELNQGISQVLPEVNTGGKSGKIVDAGVEAALGGAVLPGAARNIIPSLMGGAASEGAGQATAGTKYEPWARLLGAVVPGGIAALAQNGLGSVVQAMKNLAPNVDETSAKVIARALIRDNDTGNALAGRQADLGPGAMAVEAGGPNVRGTMRGSIAAPGPARTTAQDAFDLRIAGENGVGGSNARTTTALDKSVSPNGSLAATVDDLAELRRQQATPAYEAAGIPRRPESRITAINEPPTWNTRQVTSPELEQLVKDSPDIRQALNTLRRFPDYKDVPKDSMAMWDEAYKILGGREQKAKRAGLDRKAMLIGDLRRDYQNALVDANPDYGRALKSYAGPSELIDAGETAKSWFTKNVDPAVVVREFQAMAPAEQEAAKIGVRDWARTVIGRSDRGTAAERVWAGGDNRARLQAILSPDEFAALEKTMGVEKNAIRTARDINVGSRTAPMLAESADNALADTSIMSDLLRGHPLRAAGKFTGKAVERIGEGKTEAVNARIAEMLTSIDPEKVGMVQALAERARLAELARRSGRMNALTYGGLTVPGGNALVGADR